MFHPSKPELHYVARRVFKTLPKVSFGGVSDPAEVAILRWVRVELYALLIQSLYESPTPPIYHYTGIDTFEKMLGSGVIHATNAEQCNDKDEIKYGRDLVALVLSQQVTRYFPGTSTSMFYDYCGDLVENVAGQHHVVCFSGDRDSLYPWHCPYGRAGRGVSIGFDPRGLNRAFVAGIEGHVSLWRVIYDREQQLHELQKRCDLVREAIRWGSQRLDIRSPFSQSLAAALCSGLASRATTSFKAEGWRLENEWRLAVSLYEHEISDPAIVLQKTTGKRYVSLQFPMDRLPITVVVVGPLCTDAEFDSIRSAVLSKGYDVPVIRSEFPLQE